MQAVIVARTSPAHFIKSWSKKYRPIQWKLLSLQREEASFAPSTNMTTEYAISTLQNSTPPKLLNQFRDLTSLAAIVCLQLNSVEKIRLKVARKRMLPKMFFCVCLLKILQQPSQKLNNLQSSFASIFYSTREFTAYSQSLSFGWCTYSSFLMNQFYTGSLNDSQIDHRVKIPTQVPTTTQQATNKPLVGVQVGQSQTSIFLIFNSCIKTCQISYFVHCEGTHRPVKVLTLLVVFLNPIRKQLQGSLMGVLCSHSYFCPGLLVVIPEYIIVAMGILLIFICMALVVTA